jgi:hypothetical protein
MPTPAGQDIMNEGPGLRQRTRETNAVIGAVAPQTTGKAPAAAPPQEVDKINKKGKFGTHKGEDRTLPVDQWAKPLGSFKHGTDYVPKTGVYKLHEGEAVKTKEENKMDAFAHVPGRTEDKPKKEVHEIRTRKAKSGGFIHEHHHTHPEHHKMEEHTSPNMKSAMTHLNDHMGDGSSASDVMSDAGSANPDTQAAPAAGAPPAAAGE